MKIPILYYHSIADTPLSVKPAHFLEQMQFLKYKGIHTITLSQLVERNFDIYKEYVIITFDDCFNDVSEHALPVLLKLKMKATFFAVPGYDGLTRWGSAKLGRWSDSKEGSFNIPFHYVGKEQRRDLVVQGMEIGAHTIQHHNLTELSHEAMTSEIEGSKKMLEDELGTEVKTFCYPRGKFDNTIINKVRTTGFIGACTTSPGYFYSGDDVFTIKRFGIGNDMEKFKAIIEKKNDLLNNTKKKSILQRLKNRLLV